MSNTRIKIKCVGCGNMFDVFPSSINGSRWGHRKYCTRDCWRLHHTVWNTGRTSWSKGKHLSDEHKKSISLSLLGKNRRGHPISEETRRKISNSHTGMKKPWSHWPVLRGINNPLWKGDAVSYRSLHKWVVRSLGKATTCSVCSKTTGRIHWSNNDHKYERNLNDWTSLCADCHGKHDKELRRRILK